VRAPRVELPKPEPVAVAAESAPEAEKTDES
jgi:hypothetical protein